MWQGKEGLEAEPVPLQTPWGIGGTWGGKEDLAPSAVAAEPRQMDEPQSWLCSNRYSNSCISFFGVRVFLYLLPSLLQNFRKEMVRNDAYRRALSCGEESRGPLRKPNIHIFLSVLASSLVRLNKKFCREKEPDIEEISLVTFLMHIRSTKLLLVLLKLDAA